MHLFYSAADLVISRSGGSTVSELACFGKYALLLPFPDAAENHQEDNAKWLASAGGAEILHDKDADPVKFTEWLIRWLDQKEQFLEKGMNSKSLARPDAAQQVISMISNLINLKTKGNL
jgi:UDP-N-acetylglucosamine--N-acetylmuramyl-(pentapeptide) pyrophosphoryl-undecaprenol N-acetylglucosamine transferase